MDIREPTAPQAGGWGGCAGAQGTASGGDFGDLWKGTWQEKGWGGCFKGRSSWSWCLEVWFRPLQGDGP